MDYDQAVSEIWRVLRRPGAWTLHIFPARWRPVEPHIFTPFGGRFQHPAVISLWAHLGIRNSFQKGLGAEETAAAGLDRLEGLRRIGIDEKSWGKGQGKYLVIVTDHDAGRVAWIGEGRCQATVEAFFGDLGGQHVHHGPDEGEVPGLRAVPADQHRLAARRGVDERRDHRGVGVPGGLQRPIDVEEPQRQRRQPERRPVRKQVRLGRQLARAYGLSGRVARFSCLGSVATAIRIPTMTTRRPHGPIRAGRPRGRPANRRHWPRGWPPDPVATAALSRQITVTG